MNNKTLIVVVVVVAIMVIIAVVGGRSNPFATPTPTPSGAATNSVSPKAMTTPRISSSGSMPQSYEDAVKKYAGTRIQFDARCQAIPNQITIKTGASIMLDNRSGDARTISLGSVKYAMGGYGFRIITPYSKTLPATQIIDCGSAQNVGQVFIQR